jgi:DNA-binding NtrC family response regulator
MTTIESRPTDREETDEPSDSARLLLIEERDELHSLLRTRFPQILAIQTETPAAARGSDNGTYHIIIWASETASPNRARTLRFVSRNNPHTPVVVISQTEPDPVACGLKISNYRYIPRPIDVDKLCDFIRTALKQQPLTENLLAYPEIRVLSEFEGIIGISLPMRDVFQRILEASSADIPVLITGETGTGKDLVAAAIHNRSKRSTKPYIPVNTGAIAPELIASELFGHEKGAYTGAIEKRQGFFEQADGGTIFLDEISTMDEKAQIGLLRILETQTFRRVRGDKDLRVNVRVIAATNEDLQEAIEQKKFREDLYYRLDVFNIHLPPLRERPGGVSLLTNHFVVVFNELYNKDVRRVSPEAYRCLRRYKWPGNVRELKNVIQRAVLMTQGEELTLDVLPDRIKAILEASDANTPQANLNNPNNPADMTLHAMEKQCISMALAATQGNKKEAAVRLGISRRALYSKLKKHDLL